MAIDLLYVFKFDNSKITEATQRLNHSIDSLKGQDVNIIVFNASEKDITINPPIQYHHRHDPNNFNKPRLINYAVKNFIKSDYFIFSDIDLVYKPTHIQQLMEYYNLENPVRVIFWNYNLYKKVYSSNWMTLHNTGRDTNGGYAHGNGLIHTKSFHEIHGYDEFYLGYGPEDDDFNQRISHYSKLIYDNKICSYHLFHEHMNRDHYQRNTHYYRSRIPDMKSGKIKLVNPDKWGEITDEIIPAPPPDPKITRHHTPTNNTGQEHYRKRQIERHQSK